jgi:hypothetical protein
MLENALSSDIAGNLTRVVDIVQQEYLLSQTAAAALSLGLQSGRGWPGCALPLCDLSFHFLLCSFTLSLSRSSF